MDVIYEKPDGTEGIHRTTYLAVLLNCCACAGTWIGALVSWFAFSPVTPYLHPEVQHPRIVAAVLDGAIACGANYIGALFVNELGNALLSKLARKP